MNAEVGDLATDLSEHVLDRVDAERGELVDVLALIAALGQLLPPPPRLDRRPEEVDLPPGVVEVVLARDLVSRVLEQSCHGVSVRGVTRGADSQWPGGVGRDQLDLDPLRPVRRRPGAVLGADLLQRVGEPRAGHPEIEEARPGDFGPVDLFELLGACRQLGCQLARWLLAQWCGPQRDVRRVVSVLGIARTLEVDRRADELGEPPGQTVDRVTGQASRAERRAVRGRTALLRFRPRPDETPRRRASRPGRSRR